MSTYYTFYIAEKQPDDKFGYKGLYDGKGNIRPVISRSRSFIDSDDIHCYDTVTEDRLSDEFRKALFGPEEDTEDKKWYPNMYLIPFSTISSIGSSGGLKRGYTDLETLDIVTKNNYDPEIISEHIYKLASPDFIAELSPEERAKYGHIAYIDYNSTEFLFSFIADYVNENTYETKNTYIICVIE